MKLRATFTIVVAAAFLLSGCAGGLSGNTSSDEWPTKNIEIVVPFGAGGDTDFNARAYGSRLEDELGTSTTVVNTEGNGGATATAEVAKANPDGNTALFFHGAMLVNEASGASSNTLDDFEYVGTVGKSPGEVLVVNSDSGFENIDDLIKYSTEHPGELKVAADIGATTHIMALQLQEAGAEINIVSAGGSSERTASLKGGHVDAVFNPYGTVADYLENGDFTALANVASERAKGYSDVPTAEEQGYAEIEWTNYYFIALPKGTDSAIVETFGEAVKTISKTDDYREAINEAYFQDPYLQLGEDGLSDAQTMSTVVDKYTDELKG